MAPRLCCEVTPMLNTSCASSTTNSMTRQQHACKERKDVLDIFGSSPRRGSETPRVLAGRRDAHVRAMPRHPPSRPRRIPCQRPVLAAHPNSILAGIARANSSADARACFTRWRSTGTWSEHIARAV
ncbi:unnamed protein product [Prorocentrum cordatum]|uniref:Uncharacterized protein n=1 Tax=Prorocentrum cordatum TaxID=2364126 RepID=A0ABN9PDI6_9DINO|nr:unnamed protein product [Polarella glacialis]